MSVDTGKVTKRGQFKVPDTKRQCHSFLTAFAIGEHYQVQVGDSY